MPNLDDKTLTNKKQEGSLVQATKISGWKQWLKKSHNKNSTSDGENPSKIPKKKKKLVPDIATLPWGSRVIPAPALLVIFLASSSIALYLSHWFLALLVTSHCEHDIHKKIR